MSELTQFLIVFGVLAAGLGAFIFAGWWFWYPVLPDDPEGE